MHPGQASHDPPVSGLGARGWTVEEAATELADRDRGYDLATARAMVEEYLAGVAGGPQTATLVGDVRLDDLDIDVIIALTNDDISLEYGLATFEDYVDLPYDHVVDAALIDDAPDAAPSGRDQGQPADALHTDTVDGYGGWSPQLIRRITDPRLAVAARDGAIEVGDLPAAAAFADQAREAIAKAVEAGIDLPELADELDSPGGHRRCMAEQRPTRSDRLPRSGVRQRNRSVTTRGRAFARHGRHPRRVRPGARRRPHRRGEPDGRRWRRMVSDGGVQAGYGAPAGGAAWAVADEQTAAHQHMPGGYDTA